PTIDSVSSVLTIIGTMDEAFHGAYASICRTSRNIPTSLST
ncbi:hypothetical protein, partial [Escherichia coli]